MAVTTQGAEFGLHLGILVGPAALQPTAAAPTLSQWGLIAAAAMLSTIGVLAIRRRIAR